jgi:transcriptional regulator with XRE-family HTH domain
LAGIGVFAPILVPGNMRRPNLKKLRQKSGFTQAQLAEKVNVSTHHIGMIELSRNYPTLELVERIANALDIEIHELFIDPFSSNNELEQLRQKIKGDTKQLFDEFLEKAISANCKGKE